MPRRVRKEVFIGPHTIKNKKVGMSYPRAKHSIAPKYLMVIFKVAILYNEVKSLLILFLLNYSMLSKTLI